MFSRAVKFYYYYYIIFSIFLILVNKTQEASFISKIKLSPENFATILNENELMQFIQSLSLLPKSEIYKKFTFNPAFPLVYQDAVEESLTTLLRRLQPYTLQNMMKENQPLLLTAAPSGSGKVNICTLYLIHVYICCLTLESITPLLINTHYYSF